MLTGALALVVSCTQVFDHKNPCASEFVGDPAASPELSLIARDVSGAMVALTNGGAVPLLDAPQGGDVLFAAARVRNVDSCGMKFTGDLRDPGTNRIIGLEGRPVNLKLAGDGFLEPADPQSLSDWSNIPVCPSAAATRSIVGSAYLLELTIEDGGGRTATASLTLYPFCGNPSTEDYCRTLCSQTNGSI